MLETYTIKKSPQKPHLGLLREVVSWCCLRKGHVRMARIEDTSRASLAQIVPQVLISASSPQEKSSGRTAHYKLTSTVMLWLQTNKSGSGTMNLGGSLTRQVQFMFPATCRCPEGPASKLSLIRVPTQGDRVSQQSISLPPEAALRFRQCLLNRTQLRTPEISQLAPCCGRTRWLQAWPWFLLTHQGWPPPSTAGSSSALGSSAALFALL